MRISQKSQVRISECLDHLQRQAGWFGRNKNKNVDPMKEENVSGKKTVWMGLQPIKFIPSKVNPKKGIITARLVSKPQDYLGKVLPFEGKAWKVVGLQWGKSNKFVGLEVEFMHTLRI